MEQICLYSSSKLLKYVAEVEVSTEPYVRNWEMGLWVF